VEPAQPFLASRLEVLTQETRPKFFRRSRQRGGFAPAPPDSPRLTMKKTPRKSRVVFSLTRPEVLIGNVPVPEPFGPGGGLVRAVPRTPQGKGAGPFPFPIPSQGKNPLATPTLKNLEELFRESKRLRRLHPPRAALLAVGPRLPCSSSGFADGRRLRLALSRKLFLHEKELLAGTPGLRPPFVHNPFALVDRPHRPRSSAYL